MAALLGVGTMEIITAGVRGWLLPVSAPGVEVLSAAAVAVVLPAWGTWPR